MSGLFSLAFLLEATDIFLFMGFYCPIEFKDNLRTIEPRFPKNLRTNEARLDFTGPYKKKKVYVILILKFTKTLQLPIGL